MSIASPEFVEEFKVNDFDYYIRFKKEYALKVGFDGQAIGKLPTENRKFKNYEEFYNWYQGGMNV